MDIYRGNATSRGTGIGERQEPGSAPILDNTRPMSQPASGLDLIPGAREAGVLSTFGASADVSVSDWPDSMGAATTAERQREGGGAPNQRRGQAP